MASTLTVDNIVGATSSNTIHIPNSVVQIVQTTNNQNQVISSTSFTATYMQADITPKFATSKILILVNGGADTNTAGRGMRTTIYRNGTTNLATLSSGQQGFDYNISHGARLQVTSFMQFLDSPATTSSVNYKVYAQSTASANVEYPGTYQTKVMTLLEIAQ
jgi:hypothetical protein